MKTEQQRESEVAGLHFQLPRTERDAFKRVCQESPLKQTDILRSLVRKFTNGEIEIKI